MTTFPTEFLIDLLHSRLHWSDWEALIQRNGIEIDRPHGSKHPHLPEIVYPIDYGYIPKTLSTDREELDIFRGTGETGLVGAIFTTDFRRGDLECKLIYNATPAEIYLVNGFINYNQRLMKGDLVMRRPLHELW